ncbi:MAG: hypothetical protein KBF73_06450 [Flavobacteriales bacterium]|nr:hypothetical protein [Flavobacteriales bacterium]
MKRSLITLTVASFICFSASAQEEGNDPKIVRFNNITEVSVGMQLGGTTRVTSFSAGESEVEVAGYKMPAPRISTSFGALIGGILYVGPGIAYTFQPSDSHNQEAHQISAYGHARLNFANGKIRPFSEFKGGYHFASLKEINQSLDSDWYKWDGFFLEPALGISFKLGKHAFLNTSLGYQYVSAGNRIKQTIQDEDGGSLINATLSEKYHRFLFSIGFTFL